MAPRVGFEPGAASKSRVDSSPSETAHSNDKSGQDNDLLQIHGDCQLCNSDIPRQSVDTLQQEKCAISVQQQTAAELTALAKVVANWMILTPEARVRIEQIADRCVADSHEGS